MSTLNFLDANVWLALLWSRHMHSYISPLPFDSVCNSLGNVSHANSCAASPTITGRRLVQDVKRGLVPLSLDRDGAFRGAFITILDVLASALCALLFWFLLGKEALKEYRTLLLVILTARF
jgi:hypothetical protein